MLSRSAALASDVARTQTHAYGCRTRERATCTHACMFVGLCGCRPAGSMGGSSAMRSMRAMRAGAHVENVLMKEVFYV